MFSASLQIGRAGEENLETRSETQKRLKEISEMSLDSVQQRKDSQMYQENVLSHGNKIQLPFTPMAKFQN